MKSEDMLIYLGYFAVAAIALHFILAVLKVQSDYIYNTSIGFPNDKLQGAVIEGFKEGFVAELSEKEISNVKKAGEEVDVQMTKLEKDMLEPLKKRVKSCPQDTLDAMKEFFELIDDYMVSNFLNQAIGIANGNPKGFMGWLDKQFQGKTTTLGKIMANPTQKKLLYKYLEGKVDAKSGGGGGGYF